MYTEDTEEHEEITEDRFRKLIRRLPPDRLPVFEQFIYLMADLPEGVKPAEVKDRLMEIAELRVKPRRFQLLGPNDVLEEPPLPMCRLYNFADYRRREAEE